MIHDELDKSEPARLAGALSIRPGTPHAVSDDELRAILRDQLNTPLSIDLDESAADVTFGQLLTSAQPSPQWLQSAKCFAKFCKASADAPLPAPVGTILYFACIAKTLTANNERISALSDTDLLAGIRWSLEQTWVPQELRDLFKDAQKCLT